MYDYQSMIIKIDWTLKLSITHLELLFEGEEPEASRDEILR